MIVDRRLNGRHRNAVNRDRFVRRYKDQIRRAVAEAVGKRSITDLDRGERVDIQRKDIAEPFFHHGPGGHREAVHPGNREFVTGDRLQRPEGGAGGSGSQAGDGGEGEDDFAFVLSREEFLDFFFEDLALPDLVKKRLATIPTTKSVRAGYTQTGVPTNVNIVRSLKSAAARRRALQAPRRGDLNRAEECYCALEAAGSPPDARSAYHSWTPSTCATTIVCSDHNRRRRPSCSASSTCPARWTNRARTLQSGSSPCSTFS